LRRRREDCSDQRVSDRVRTAGSGEKAATDKKTDAAAGVGVVRTGEIVANRFLLSSY
jgi:hypothetical protein